MSNFDQQPQLFRELSVRNVLTPMYKLEKSVYA